MRAFDFLAGKKVAHGLYPIKINPNSGKFTSTHVRALLALHFAKSPQDVVKYLARSGTEYHLTNVCTQIYKRPTPSCNLVGVPSFSR